MNIIDRAIGFFSPSAGLKRAYARKVLRGYQGAEATRLNNNKRPKNQSADSELIGPSGADSLRAWARSMVRDNAYAWNIVDTIVSNVIGDGITAQSTYETPAGEDVEDVNDIRDSTFSAWCEVADINGELTFSEIQILAQREIVEAGEVLIRFINTPGKTYKGITRPVPLALEMIEADRLSLERDTFAARINSDNGNRIVRGVELDDKGKPVAYHIYKDNPNTPFAAVSRVPERIPASEIVHLYRKDRVGQTRGVTWFAPVMQPMRDLGVYIENELIGSAVASCFAAVIKTEGPAGSIQAPDGDDTSDSRGNSFEYLEPGIVGRLNPGESIESVNPARPNSSAEPWINLILRGMCAGTGTNYEAIAKDFSKTSYSSSRSSKLEDRPRYRRGQNYIVNHLCLPVWDEFCNAAARVDAKGFPTATELLDDRRKAAPVEWQLPEQEWVDPSSEQNAAESSLKSYTDTYQNVLGARGLSYRQVFYQRAKEEQLRLKLGLLTPEEKTAQMMARQTEATSVSDASSVEMGTSEMMGLSTQQWNRNRKAIQKTLDELTNGTMSEAAARVFLSSVGMSKSNVDLLISDVADGSLDTELPGEVPVVQ